MTQQQDFLPHVGNLRRECATFRFERAARTGGVDVTCLDRESNKGVRSRKLEIQLALPFDDFVCEHYWIEDAAVEFDALTRLGVAFMPVVDDS